MAPAKPAPSRKRNRKRKRRLASSSSSSSSDSSDSSSDEGAPKVTIKKHVPVKPQPAHESSSEQSSSSSSSSDSDSEPEAAAAIPQVTPATQARSTRVAQEPRRSPSPSPPPAPIPSFLPSVDDKTNNHDEGVLKERFHKFWMGSVADGFRDDLEQIRKEPHMTTSRLSLLIDSLASGADVFTSTTTNSNNVNEMDIVLNGSNDV